jgi:Tfp pilus assembly protein PilV
MHTTVKKFRLNTFSRQRQKGITLTEVIVAAVLLLIALVPILQALTQANMNSTIIERRTQSLCLAQAKINQLQAQSTYNFAGIATLNNEVLSGSYLGNTTVTTSGTLKTIKVDVGLDRNANGTLGSDEVEITLQTQIAQRW